jgi:hypothetical protein
MTHFTCGRFLSATVLICAAGITQADESPVAPSVGNGWTQTELAVFTEQCTLAIVLPAKRKYAETSEHSNKPSPKPFPEALLRASIEPLCGCIGQRVAEAKSLDAFASEGLDFVLPFIEEAMAGGRCKPEGVLGEMLSKRQSR